MTIVLALAAVLFAVAWLWSLLAIRYFAPFPASLRTGLIVLLAFGPWLLLSVTTTAVSVALACVIIVPVILGWLLVRPRNDLDWSPDQARTVHVEFDGDLVTIHNLRRATYLTVTDFGVEWYSQTFDLGAVRTVEYVVEPFGKLPATAHTFVTFGFTDGEYLPISIEIRRERPEAFNPIAGIYRQFEIMYVMGDERDLIGLRANIRKDDVYLYPIRASRDQVRRMLESMLLRANKLSSEPEFYNTLTNNCATNVLRHLNEIEGKRFPLDYRIVAPGWSDRYAYEHGLIDTTLPFDEAKPLYRINEQSAFGEASAKEWSAQIRKGLGSP